MLWQRNLPQVLCLTGERPARPKPFRSSGSDGAYYCGTWAAGPGGAVDPRRAQEDSALHQTIAIPLSRAARPEPRRGWKQAVPAAAGQPRRQSACPGQPAHRWVPGFPQFAGTVPKVLAKDRWTWQKGAHGQLAEWSKAHAWKVCRRGTVSRVRIPHCPPPIIVFASTFPSVRKIRHYTGQRETAYSGQRAFSHTVVADDPYCAGTEQSG
jgi:hypothetical protein